MWYIFNASNQCIATANQKPDVIDLEARQEKAVDHSELINVNDVELINGKVTKKVYQLTQDELLNQIRLKRNRLLSETDKYMLEDYPVSTEQRNKWTQYRQLLRDFPDYCDVNNPEWPVSPE